MQAHSSMATSRGDAVEISTRARLAEIIVRMQQGGEGFRTPLLRAAAEGHLSLVVLSRGTPVPARFLTLERPTALLLADDHPGASGPARWKQIRRLLRWANTVILHATGGQSEHYAMAAAATMMMRRVLLVEMEQQHHDAWRTLVDRYAPRLRVLSIVPPPGDCHPRPGAPRGEVLQ